MRSLSFVLVITLAACTTAGAGPGGGDPPAQVTVDQCNCNVTNALGDGGVDDAGTDAGPPAKPTLASGTRLKVIYSTSVDGLRVPQSLTTFFDAEKLLKCMVVDVVGTPRCIPATGPSRGNDLYESSTCDTGMLVLTITQTSAQGYVRITSSSDISGEPIGVFTREEEYMGPVYHKQSNGACVLFDASGVPANQKFYRVGADVTATFAEITEEIAQ